MLGGLAQRRWCGPHGAERTDAKRISPPHPLLQVVPLVLLVHHVVHCLLDAFLAPQVSFASVVGPGAVWILPAPLFSQCSSGIGFQGAEYQSGTSSITGNHCMHVVSPGIDGEQVPFADRARISDGLLDEVPLLHAECNCRLVHETFILPSPILVGRQKR